MSSQMKLVIVAGVLLVTLVIVAGLAYQHGKAAQAAFDAATQAEEARNEAKEALERGDGGWLYRDILRRARKPLPR